MRINYLLTLAIVAMVLASCGSTKQVPYMINADQLPADVLQAAAKAADPVLMNGDLIQINVSSADPEVVKPFNKSEYIANTGNLNSSTNQDNSIYYYLIDNNGDIEFPIVGKIHAAGMTVIDLQDKIASEIYPKYVNVKPGVECRLQNFKVYTMGEVKNPGVVRAPNGRINVLEAIAQSGDLTIQGRRDNVMLIRTNADGSRSVKTINLNDPKVIVSPEFNLQQNDIIYVEPNASKARSSWSMPPGLTLGLSILGTLMSLTTLVVTLTK